MPVEPGVVNAPEFPTDLDWLNTSRALSIKELRGKAILLDFWTYCCINCMHVLPDLKKLEHKYADELVVIGVHSAKFLAERQTENIRQAILRYGIEHPVINDDQMRVWQEYAARAWPTLILIDPRGKIIGSHSGEGVFEVFDPVIGQLIEHHAGEGDLVRGPLELARETEPASLLSYPGKVLADEAGDRLFISDSNHHRIVVASLTTGNVLEIVGGGDADFADGTFDEARFSNPQGLAIEGDLLYIADTDNHAVRRADLRSQTVVTLAGTGEQSFDFDSRPGPARGRALNSPWDLELAHGVLFIAMAGSHQIWGLDLEGGYIAGHAGSGEEDHRDGPLLGAALAQPSGLSHDNDALFVADSEVSSIRAVDFDPRGGHVKTVIGEGLFDYGDVDGGPDVARLQHPLDVEYVEGQLFVADTYNNKIRAIGLATRTTRGFAGSGEAGLTDGPLTEAQFDEPAGLSSAHGKLYVADTNNHVIRIVDLDRSQVSTFPLQDAHKLARSSAAAITLPRQSIAPSAKLRIDLALPEGARLSRDSPSQVAVIQQGDLRVLAAEDLPAEIEIADGTSDVRVEASIYYCQSGREQLCLYSMRNYELALDRVDDGSPTASLSILVAE